MINNLKKYLIFLLLLQTSSLLSQNFDEIHFKNDSILKGFLFISGKIANKNKIKYLTLKYELLFINLNEIELIKNLNNKIIYQKPVICIQCNGSGKVKKYCKKYTIISSYNQEKKQQISKKKIHALCNGKGYYFEKCRKCNGEGKIK